MSARESRHSRRLSSTRRWRFVIVGRLTEIPICWPTVDCPSLDEALDKCSGPRLRQLLLRLRSGLPPLAGAPWDAAASCASKPAMTTFVCSRARLMRPMAPCSSFSTCPHRDFSSHACPGLRVAESCATSAEAIRASLPACAEGKSAASAEAIRDSPGDCRRELGVVAAVLARVGLVATRTAAARPPAHASLCAAVVIRLCREGSVRRKSRSLTESVRPCSAASSKASSSWPA
mmetsp:Transcript_82954/g.256487  ORF Transcript_82954/g.256487 Transcript_82954/m.256487 type:complete len:233 (+) Transcript_82954:155-853(+)